MDLALNWIWQGSAIALAAATLIALARPSARVRYGVWSLALVLVLITPLIALLRTMAVVVVDSPAMSAPASSGTTAALLQLPHLWWTSSAVAIGIWAGWAVVHAARLASAIRALWRIKQRCQPLDERFTATLPLWHTLRSQGRPTRIALSNGVPAAAVLGGRSPVVAISPRVIDELSAEEIDSIVAHEWAHVQRRDDLVALMQAVVRVIAGWHPAVWWLDRRISTEREHACDETVVQLTGSAKNYAACLVRVAGLSMQPVRPMPVVAMSATGLRPRVRRILSARRSNGARSRRGASLVGAAALATLAVSIADVRLIEGARPDVADRNVDQRPLFTQLPIVLSQSLVPALEAAAPQPVTSAPTGKARPQASAGSRALSAVTTAAAEQMIGASPAPPIEPIAPAADEPLRAVSAGPLVPLHTTLPTLREALAASGAGTAQATALPQEPTPWSAAADAGVAIGRGSHKAAVATAGFFSRFGKKVASSF